MRIAILTIFPSIFEGFLEASLIQKARESGVLEITTSNIRAFADLPHFQVDDSPYGGGAGMVMKPEPLTAAIESAKQSLPKAKTVLLTPSGRVFDQAKAAEFSTLEEMILVCGRYEGVDQRVIDLLIDEELSIGDYVLMGGEVGAMAVIEAVTRLVPGVIGNAESLSSESFAANAEGERLLEAPQYTRPAEFRGRTVPDVLLSGNHRQIELWRQEQSRKLTAERRPDLLRRKS